MKKRHSKKSSKTQKITPADPEEHKDEHYHHEFYAPEPSQRQNMDEKKRHDDKPKRQEKS